MLNKFFSLIAIVSLVAGVSYFLLTQSNSQPQQAEAKAVKVQWSQEADRVLRGYLSAASPDERLQFCTQTKETQTLIQLERDSHLPKDVVRADDFAIKPLPPSFAKHGIYLMYYQRPNVLVDDALFRPLVPMRVGMQVDLPEFLDEAARSGFLRPRERQNVCAFFKYDQGQLTMDWPLFVQTRYRKVKSFFEKQPRQAAKQNTAVLRILLAPIDREVARHHYDSRLINHDWYQVSCPGYDGEYYPLAVAQSDPTAARIKERLANYPGGVLALTAELSRVEHSKQPVVVISKLICFEFYGLNHDPLTKEK